MLQVQVYKTIQSYIALFHRCIRLTGIDCNYYSAFQCGVKKTCSFSEVRDEVNEAATTNSVKKGRSLLSRPG